MGSNSRMSGRGNAFMNTKPKTKIRKDGFQGTASRGSHAQSHRQADYRRPDTQRHAFAPIAMSKTRPDSSHLHPGPANSTKRFLCTNHQLPITIHKPVAQPKAFKGELSCTWRAPIFTYLHLSSPKLTYLHQTLCLASTQMDESEPTRTHRR